MADVEQVEAALRAVENQLIVKRPLLDGISRTLGGTAGHVHSLAGGSLLGDRAVSRMNSAAAAAVTIIADLTGAADDLRQLAGQLRNI